MLLCYFKLYTERYLNRGKKPNAEINLGSKSSNNNLWAVLDVFPVVVQEELNVFVATSVHYVAICFEKQHNRASPTLLTLLKNKISLEKRVKQSLGLLHAISHRYQQGFAGFKLFKLKADLACVIIF